MSDFIPYSCGDTPEVERGDTITITWTTTAHHPNGEVAGKSITIIKHLVAREKGISTGITTEGIVVWKDGMEGGTKLFSKKMIQPFSQDILDRIWSGELDEVVSC